MQVFWDHLAATFNRPLASRSSLLPNSLHEEGYLFQSCSVNDIHDFVKILCQMIFTVSYCNKYRLVSPPHVFIESFSPRVSRRTNVCSLAQSFTNCAPHAIRKADIY